MSESNESKQLGELVSLRTEKVAGSKDRTKPYVGLEHIASGEPFLLGVAHSESSVSTNSVFHRGDILFGKLRPNLQKSLLARFDGYCSTDILVLEPCAGFDSSFVARVFQRDEVFAEAVRTAEGTKMPRTSWARLRQYPVFAPDDASEQRAIAAVLDAVDVAIQKTEALIAKLKAIKAGLLHDLLTRGLDSNGQLRDPEEHPEQFKDTLLGRVPAEWDGVVVNRLREVLTEAGHNVANDRRDLYLLADEEITHLFEVKTDLTTTSLYQGIGQLMFHGAARDSTPRRILVLPDRPNNTTQQVLRCLGIAVLVFEWEKGRPAFPRLGDVLG